MIGGAGPTPPHPPAFSSGAGTPRALATAANPGLVTNELAARPNAGRNGTKPLLRAHSRAGSGRHGSGLGWARLPRPAHATRFTPPQPGAPSITTEGQRKGSGSSSGPGRHPRVTDGKTETQQEGTYPGSAELDSLWNSGHSTVITCSRLD